MTEPFELDGELYRHCPDCEERRLASDFERDGSMHEVCSFCSPPAEMPSSVCDLAPADEGQRIVDGFEIMKSDT